MSQDQFETQLSSLIDKALEEGMDKDELLSSLELAAQDVRDGAHDEI